MIKIDKGLDLINDLGGGLKIDSKLVQSEWRVPIIPDCVVGPDQRETGSKGMKFGGLGTNSGG